MNYRSENNFLGNLKIISNAVKNLDNLATSLSVLNNYFDIQQNYFSDLYPEKHKILDKNKVRSR